MTTAAIVPEIVTAGTSTLAAFPEGRPKPVPLQSCRYAEEQFRCGTCRPIASDWHLAPYQPRSSPPPRLVRRPRRDWHEIPPACLPSVRNSVAVTDTSKA